jgi:hypothetical protein
MGPGKSLNDLHHVVPGTGSYAFVSDRAVFVHKVYLELLSYHSTRQSGCCDVILSAQVSAAFERPPVVVKANVMDLEVVGSSSDTQLGATSHHHNNGICDDRCLPSWLPKIDDWRTFLPQPTAILK